MALKKLSKAYGTQYAGLTASLRDSSGTPARMYGLPTGGLPSPSGQITLDSQGGFSTYVDDGRLYQIAVYGPNTSGVLLNDQNMEVDATSTEFTSTQYASLLALADASAVSTDKTIFVARNSAGIILTGTTVETVMWSTTFPAGSFRSGDRLIIASHWAVTSSANAKTMKCLFGTTPIGNRVLYSKVINTVGQVGFSPTCEAWARTPELWVTPYSASYAPNTGSSYPVTTEIVMSDLVDNVLQFSGLLADAADSIQLSSFEVSLTRVA